ncbi:hypothetical protein [Aromatoleum anaerobium]|uniref:Uncharacterized protein n=1 Tax=Aromatoleum anaerobium TaxID=182180 RepID=A0ABX1PHV1_9RHOO|nr:hypothetical protein [Aromatoleum anaerobium]MCK0508807.1 hypothetical protein [Aromatoleum anaerobium]
MEKVLIHLQFRQQNLDSVTCFQLPGLVMNRRLATSVLLVSALLFAPPLAFADVEESARSERLADRAAAPGPLQQRMEVIRAMLVTSIDAHPDLRLSRAEGAALALEVGREIDSILADKAISRAAGRQASFLLGDMRDGLDLMRTASHDDARRVGLMKVVQDLRLYGLLFEHPGWQGVPEIR